MIEFRLSFGLNRQDGSPIHSADAQAFIAAHIGQFGGPKGYTLFKATGVWESKPEACLILSVLASAAYQETEYALDALAEKYASAFSQDAVLLSAHPVDAAVLIDKYGTRTNV